MDSADVENGEGVLWPSTAVSASETAESEAALAEMDGSDGARTPGGLKKKDSGYGSMSREKSKRGVSPGTAVEGDQLTEAAAALPNDDDTCAAAIPVDPTPITAKVGPALFCVDPNLVEAGDVAPSVAAAPTTASASSQQDFWEDQEPGSPFDSEAPLLERLPDDAGATAASILHRPHEQHVETHFKANHRPRLIHHHSHSHAGHGTLGGHGLHMVHDIGVSRPPLHQHQHQHPHHVVPLRKPPSPDPSTSSWASASESTESAESFSGAAQDGPVEDPSEFSQCGTMPPPIKRSFSKKKGARLSVRTAPPSASTSEFTMPMTAAVGVQQSLPTFKFSNPPGLATQESYGMASHAHQHARDTDSLRDNPYKYGPARILPYLYLGCKDNARDVDILSSLGIRYLLNVAKEVRNPVVAEGTAIDMVEEFSPSEDRTRRLRACDDEAGEGKAEGEFGVCREVVVRITPGTGALGAFCAKNGDVPANVEAILIGRDTWPEDQHSSHPPAPSPVAFQQQLYSSLPPHMVVRRAETALLSRATSEFFELGLKRMPSFDHSMPHIPHGPRSPSVPATARPHTPKHSPRAVMALEKLPACETATQHLLHLHSLHLPWTHTQCIKRARSPGGLPCEKGGWADEMEYALSLIDHARQSHAPLLLSCSLGVARSASLAIAYVMRTLRLDLSSAYTFVRSRAPGVMPDVGMMGRLLELDAEWRGKESARLTTEAGMVHHHVLGHEQTRGRKREDDVEMVDA